MKTITKYVCEICGSEFDNKKDALACEKSHDDSTPRKIECSRIRNVEMKNVDMQFDIREQLKQMRLKKKKTDENPGTEKETT